MEATWNRNREHQGIQVSFPGKPEQAIIDQLKRHGFKWSGRQKIWYAKEQSWRVEYLNSIATYGGEVGEELSFAEKMEAKVERSKERAERYAGYAQSAEKRSTGHFNSAHSILDVIPPGQPILVGHHSEGRHRRDLSWVDSHMRKSIEESEKADYLASRAAASASYEKRTFNIGTTLRRIKKLEAEFRVYWRELDKEIERMDKISRRNLEWAEAGMNRVQEQINYWKGVVGEIEEQGVKLWGPKDFKKGDRIIARGSRATVTRVNPKSLTVNFDTAWMNALTITKVLYEELLQGCKNVQELEPKVEPVKEVA